MTAPVRLGAVEYLNARPLVYRLRQSTRFSLRFDVPAQCADLLHAGQIDVGLIPSIEYLRAPSSVPSYEIVPDLAIASSGPVASVALYATRSMKDVRSIVLDTSSRTSVALVRVLCARVFGIAPRLVSRAPDLRAMLAQGDAALIIGDNALLQGPGDVDVPQADGPSRRVAIEKIDLGDVWTAATGLPFVYAFWAARTGVLSAADVAELQQARDRGIAATDEIAAEYFGQARQHWALGGRYLRDNIKYSLGEPERAGLERFYRYAFEAGAVERAVTPRFIE